MKRWRLAGRMRPQHLVGALLLAWAVGLVVASVRLQSWQREVTSVMIQLRADDLLRSSVRERDQIQPEWYQRRALALLSAVERLRENTSWTLVMPGSWRIFDDLQDRAAAKIDAAFSRIVVETIRRELDTRAARLSGLPQRAPGGEVETASACPAPAATQTSAPANAQASPSLEQLPEYQSTLRHLAQVRELDRAVGALLALRQPETARTEDMRLLVRYSLGAELSGTASRSLGLFHAQAMLPQQQAEALVERLRFAVWCSTFKSAQAIHARWLGQQELFATEERLARLGPATLFEPSSRVGWSTSVARMRTAAELLDRQARAVAESQPWMFTPEPKFGPAYDELLKRVGDIRLLGPEAVARIQADAAEHHAQFRRRFDAQFARAGAGVVRDTSNGNVRLVLSPERSALQAGLVRLLDEPFMKEVPRDPAVHPAAFVQSPDAMLEELAELVRRRHGFMRGSLKVFPKAVQSQVSRYVDDRMAQHAFDQIASYVATETDPMVGGYGRVHQAHHRADRVEATVVDAGAPSLAARLRQRLEREVLAPIVASAATQAPNVTQALSPSVPSSMPSSMPQSIPQVGPHVPQTPGMAPASPPPVMMQLPVLGNN